MKPELKIDESLWSKTGVQVQIVGNKSNIASVDDSICALLFLLNTWRILVWGQAFCDETALDMAGRRLHIKDVSLYQKIYFSYLCVNECRWRGVKRAVELRARVREVLQDARVYGCLPDCNIGAKKRTLVFVTAQGLLTARPYLLSKLIYHFYKKF